MLISQNSINFSFLQLNESNFMKKRLLSLMAVAITVTFTACHQTGEVNPVTDNVRVNNDLTELIDPGKLIDYVRASGAGLANAHARVATITLTPAQVEAAFSYFDADQSGQLSDVELFNVLNQNPYDVKVTITQVQQLIAIFDTNSNGFLEYEEFEKLIEEALKRLNEYA